MDNGYSAVALFNFRKWEITIEAGYIGDSRCYVLALKLVLLKAYYVRVQILQKRLFDISRVKQERLNTWKGVELAFQGW